MSGYKVVQLGTVTPRKFDQLLDVNMTGVEDGNLVAYAASTKTFVPYVGSGDIPPNLTISNINVSGVSTFGGVTISNGIITSSNPGFSSVVYYGDGSKLTGIVGISSYVPTAGFATVSGISSYSNISGYSTSSGISSYSNISGYSTFSGISSYSATSGIATYSTSSGFSTYSNISGYSTTSGIATYSNVSGIATFASTSGYSTSSGISSYSNTSGVANTSYNISGGQSGNLIYQVSPGISSFLPNGVFGQVLGFNDGYPVWQNISAVSGGTGISVYDEDVLVGTGGSISALNFTGTNVSAIVSPVTGGISTIKINDNLVGISLSISGISTFNSSVSVGGSFTAVEFYGSGKSLTGVLTESRGLRIFDEGNIVGSGYSFTNLNFVGDNVTVSGIGTTATVTINSGVVGYSSISGISSYATISGYSTFSGVSTFSNVSDIATYATNSGFSTGSGISSYAIISGLSTYSTFSGIATYSTNSGYSTSSGIATFANVAGYSTSSGIATFAAVSGLTTFANVSGYSTSSGIATFANVAGIASFVAPGGTSGQGQYNLSGILTGAAGLTFDGSGNIDLGEFTGRLRIPLSVSGSAAAGHVYLDSGDGFVRFRDGGNTERRPMIADRFNPGYATGAWIGPPLNAAPSTATAALQFLRFPWSTYIAEPRTFQIAVRTASTFTGSTTFRLCVFSNANARPLAVVFDSGDITATAASTNYVSSSTVTLQPGFYHFGFLATAISGTAAFQGTGANVRSAGTNYGEFSSTTTVVNTTSLASQTSIPATIDPATLTTTNQGYIIPFLIPQ